MDEGRRDISPTPPPSPYRLARRLWASLGVEPLLDVGKSPHVLLVSPNSADSLVVGLDQLRGRAVGPLGVFLKKLGDQFALCLSHQVTAMNVDAGNVLNRVTGDHDESDVDLLGKIDFAVHAFRNDMPSEAALNDIDAQ